MNGLCDCGCGIPTRSYSGVPRRFVQGHYWRHRNNFEPSESYEKLKRYRAAFEMVKKFCNGAKKEARSPQTILNKLHKEGIDISLTCLKTIWGRAHNRGWIRLGWREVEKQIGKAKAATRRWYDRNADAERARKRVYGRKRYRTHGDRVRLTNFSSNLRRSRKHPGSMLVNFCVNMDAPVFDSGVSLYDFIPSSDPDPLEALMLKEEAELERKYHLFRSNKNRNIEIARPVSERMNFGLKQPTLV